MSEEKPKKLTPAERHTINAEERARAKIDAAVRAWMPAAKARAAFAGEALDVDYHLSKIGRDAAGDAS